MDGRWSSSLSPHHSHCLLSIVKLPPLITQLQALMLPGPMNIRLSGSTRCKAWEERTKAWFFFLARVLSLLTGESDQRAPNASHAPHFLHMPGLKTNPSF